MNHTRTRLLLLAVAYLGFISLGLPDTLFGVAWPFARHDFGLPLSMAGTAFIAAGTSYAISAAMAGNILGRLGVGSVLFWSSALVSLAVFGFALSPAWWFFVACTFLHGFGSGAIDTGLNHYAARHFSAGQMNWLHACFGLGAALGPATMTAAIVTTQSWRNGYAVVGGMLLALTLLFFATRHRWRDPLPHDAEKSPPGPALRESLGIPALRFHLLVFFIYAGAESAVGQWTFTFLAEARGFSEAAAGFMVSAYWAALLIGRISSGFVVDRIGPARLVRWSTLAATAGAALAIAPLPSSFTVAGILLTGFAFAPIFPCLMSLTPARVGELHSGNAIGLQVTAATLGIALLPALAGLAADSFGRGSLAAIWLFLALTLLALHIPRRSKG